MRHNPKAVCFGLSLFLLLLGNACISPGGGGGGGGSANHRFYQDADGDGFGDPAISVAAASAPRGYVADNTDCDPTDRDHWGDCGACADTDGDDQGAGCDRGVDCDDSTATGFACSDGCLTTYADADGDGYGDPAVSQTACFVPTGFALSNTDCAPADSVRWSNCGTCVAGPGDQYVVIGYSELGMHCMNQDYSQIAILPPFDSVHAQVLVKGDQPCIVTDGVTIAYSFANNTHSADKTNFWDFDLAEFGVDLPLNVGLTGNGMSGTMLPSALHDWVVTGIPITPLDDSGHESILSLADISVVSGGNTLATTKTVVPVSWDINCIICHSGPKPNMVDNILDSHDKLHGIVGMPADFLVNQQPMLCASCHEEYWLGTMSDPGARNFSSALHNAHAPRMHLSGLANPCLACHPSPTKPCLRDIHAIGGMTCTSCHGSMAAVADQTRSPWLSEPRCGNCHTRVGFKFEQPGTLYRDSIGHGGLHCTACHGAPHTIAPSPEPNDNLQAEMLQGHDGQLSDCLVCHKTQPKAAFHHYPLAGMVP